jgi:hypothetical protein
MAIVKEKSKTFPLWFQSSKNANYSNEYLRCLKNMPLGTMSNTITQPFSAITNMASQTSGGILAPNGKIYCPPYGRADILVINPADNTTYTFGTGLGGYLWSGGVLADNGKIYCPPYAGDSIFVIDTSNDTYYEILEGSFTVGTTTDVWQGGAKGSNGKIYFAPYRNVPVIALDPATETYSYITTGLAHVEQANFGSACTGADGNVYMIPLYYENVMKINVSNDTMSYLSTNYLGNIAKWRGGVLAPNGNIYCSAFVGTTVLKINTISGTTSELSFAQFQYNGRPAIDIEGNIWIPPFTAYPIPLKITTQTDAVTSVGSPIEGSHASFVTALNGKIYTTPYNTTKIYVVGTDNVIDENFPLSAMNTKA